MLYSERTVREANSAQVDGSLQKACCNLNRADRPTKTDGR